MIYPNEIKLLISHFSKAYTNGEFEKAEEIAAKLLNASIEARVQTSILSVMNVGCGKHKSHRNDAPQA